MDNFRPPWFALHEHTDSGMPHGLVGVRRLIDAYCEARGIAPEVLLRISPLMFRNVTPNT